MDFAELLQKRRSIRDFEDQPVSLGLVKEIIADSIKAPSAGHKQPWSFIIVNNSEVIKRISDSSRDTILRGIERNPNSPMKGYEKSLRAENFNAFYNAPCLVLIAGPEKSPTIRMDVGLAASYFMFSAASRGLGTCWIALGAEVRDTGLLEELGLPEGQRIIAPLVLGYPKKIPTMPERKEPDILKVIA